MSILDHILKTTDMRNQLEDMNIGQDRLSFDPRTYGMKVITKYRSGQGRCVIDALKSMSSLNSAQR